MIPILSNDRNPDTQIANQGFSGRMVDRRSSEKHSTRPFPLNPSQSRSSGVLERSDRKTDCFRNGSSMLLMPIVGKQVLAWQPKARSTRARPGITITSRGPFTETVCNSNREKSEGILRLCDDLGPKWHDMSRGLYLWASNMGRAVGMPDD